MATSIVTILALIIQLLPQILAGVGVITPKMSGLIEQIGAAVPGVVSAVVTGGSVDDKVLATLRALQTEIQAIGNSTTVNPASLQLIESLDNGITNALADYEQAQVTDDPSTLTPLPETL